MLNRNTPTKGKDIMEAAIEKHENPVDKSVIREAIITKAIVEYPDEYDWLNNRSIEQWLFGSHEVLYRLLNRIKWDDSHQLGKTYDRFLAAKTEKTRQKHLTILVDTIYGYLAEVFTAENHQKFVENREQAKALVDRGINWRNQRVLDGLDVLLSAPLWDNVLN